MPKILLRQRWCVSRRFLSVGKATTCYSLDIAVSVFLALILSLSARPIIWSFHGAYNNDSIAQVLQHQLVQFDKFAIYSVPLEIISFFFISIVNSLKTMGFYVRLLHKKFKFQLPLEIISFFFISIVNSLKTMGFYVRLLHKKFKFQLPLHSLILPSLFFIISVKFWMAFLKLGIGCLRSSTSWRYVKWSLKCDLKKSLY